MSTVINLEDQASLEEAERASEKQSELPSAYCKNISWNTSEEKVGNEQYHVIVMYLTLSFCLGQIKYQRVRSTLGLVEFRFLLLKMKNHTKNRILNCYLERLYMAWQQIFCISAVSAC